MNPSLDSLSCASARSGMIRSMNRIITAIIVGALGVLPGDKLLFETDGVSVPVRPVRTKSPFEKYRGIGRPGIARGKKAVVEWVRKPGR